MKEKTSWSLADCIDFEYFSILDQDKADEELIRRDRDIYVRNIREEPPPGRAADVLLLGVWLQARRTSDNKEEGPALLPGQLWLEVYRLCFLAMAVSGLILGGSLAWGFLTYSGRQPINVAVFLSLFVGSQLILLALLALAFAYRSLLGQAGTSFPLLAGLLSRMFFRMVRKLHGAAMGHLSAGRRHALLAALATFRIGGHRYGRLVLWPFFSLLQLFGITYNLGLLSVLLFKVAVTDIAFGWQSSLDLSAAAVHRLAALLALPWSWLLGEGSGYPTLEQIRGSRLVLKEGIYHLSTIDLVSWWPFLCLALLCYGLLPRLLLFFLGWFRLHVLLAGLDFSHSRFRRVLRRMRTPSLATRAESRNRDSGQAAWNRNGQEASPSPAPADSAERADEQPEKPGLAGEQRLLLLVPADLEEQFSLPVFREHAGPLLGDRKMDLRFFDDSDQALESVASFLRQVPGVLDVLLLQESWLPPIRETLTFLASLRDLLGTDSELTLLLVGRPRADTMFTPVKTRDRQIWQTRLASLADPALYIRELVRS